MTDRLRQKQTAAMLTLMALAREVTNPELDAIAGFVLDGKDRRLLNDRGLVASRKKGRAYAHELTDRGWAWCADELTTKTPPPPHGTLSGALYVLLDSINGYLNRANLSLADLFAVQAKPDRDEIESRIRAAYTKLARSPRDWVGLAELRPMLGDTPTAEVDAVLKELSRTGQVALVPESNRKALTTADHDAAIHIGGEENHLLSIGAS